ncbi:MAG: hypothetical protein AAGE43_16010 [Pseudomonadota bacterium]
MNPLAKVFVFKIAVTILFWVVPLIAFPTGLLGALDMPTEPTDLFLRLLGWAYVALCVGYGFGLRAALADERLAGPIWVGIVSNGGASLYLTYYGASGAFSELTPLLQVLLWSSALATGLITLGLVQFGVRSRA